MAALSWRVPRCSGFAAAAATAGRRPMSISSRTLVVRASSDDKLVVETNGGKRTTSGPDPKKFQVKEGQLGQVAAATLPFVMRAGSGILVSGWKAEIVKDEGQSGYTLFSANGNRLKETSNIPSFARPEKPLEIYEFEGCPFCKKVREAVSILDLDVIFYPCPRDSITWRPKVLEMGGKAMFPYMVDPNTGTAMYESDDIITYLFEKYGDGEVPLMLNMGALTAITAGLGQIASMRGNKALPSKIPEEPLVLWGFEGSPFVKLVREVLCELEVPYLLKTCARGSMKRDAMLEKFDHFQVPCLEDPNTGESMFESSYIVDYIEKTYKA